MHSSDNFFREAELARALFAFIVRYLCQPRYNSTVALRANIKRPALFWNAFDGRVFLRAVWLLFDF